MTDRTGDSEKNNYATDLWLQVLPKDYVLKDSNGNCYLAFIQNDKDLWEFGTSMMSGYYTIFKSKDLRYSSFYLGFSKLSDSQKQAPGSITNTNFKDIVICTGLCSIPIVFFDAFINTIILFAYILSCGWILDLLCYLITFSWWKNTCNFNIYKIFKG